MSGLFGGSPKVKEPPPPPDRSQAEVEAAAVAERRRRQLASGRASTMLTGGLGDTSTASVSTARLLGQ